MIFRIAANSELRQKVLDLVSIKNGSLGLRLGLDKKVLFTRLVSSGIHTMWPNREKDHAWTLAKRCGQCWN